MGHHPVLEKLALALETVLGLGFKRSCGRLEHTQSIHKMPKTHATEGTLEATRAFELVLESWQEGVLTTMSGTNGN